MPQAIYGYQLKGLTEREQQLRDDIKEQEVRDIFAARAKAAQTLLTRWPASYEAEKVRLSRVVEALKAADKLDGASAKPRDEMSNKAREEQRRIAQAALDRFPKNADDAKVFWTREAGFAARARPPPPHAEAFPGDQKASDIARKNFLALVFCLMVGTAALPHILTRFYTTPSVRTARSSVTWALFFIFLLYFTAPALAVLVKYEVYNNLVGTSFAALPAWVQFWTRVDPNLLSVVDVNRDGILQLAELTIGGDIVVLATPEIAGLPYVISALVAAGGLAAALSTADGLLLTIANALSHDCYYMMIDPNASTQRRVAVSKVLLLVVALLAAYVASLKITDILDLVGAAFSLAASSLFPALVLGIFWKRTNKWGAILGMIAGFGICAYYMATTHPGLRGLLGLTAPAVDYTWWDIAPISAGVFGVPLAFAVTVVVSLLTPAPDAKTQALVEYIRFP